MAGHSLAAVHVQHTAVTNLCTHLHYSLFKPISHCVVFRDVQTKALIFPINVAQMNWMYVDMHIV